MSIRDHYAKTTIAKHLAKLAAPNGPWHHGLPSPRKPLPRSPAAQPVKVGIIGAGAAGLYAALIIDSFKDARITYDIVDANPMKDRTGGGRLFTYHFSESENDYFDVGAMRFPDIPFMKPVFQLIRDNPKSPIAGMLKLIPYVMDNPNNLNFYNGTIMTDDEVQKNPTPDPFNTGVNPPGTVDQMVSASIGGFKNALKTDFATGWDALMKYDQWSMRDYTALSPDGPQYNNDSWIDFMETFDSASNLYDCALAESVMDSLDFDYADNVQWYCIQGGAGLIADKMASVLSQKIQYSKRVTAFAISNDETQASVNVTFDDGAPPTNYPHVISTMPLSCLRMVDTTQCSFDWNTQTAMRTLHYDCSVKVAIKFSSRWWESSTLANGPHLGGISSTDRPTRVVVYPSYGIGGPDATMIASYTWAQDALRFGALAQGEGSEAETLLIKRVLQDLADMHGMDCTALTKLMVGYKVHDWYEDVYSIGAFALFGPGNFSSLYPHVTQPVGGVFHFAGEATSVHHAWVLGAFNSAYRAILEILTHEGWTDLADQLNTNWGPSGEIDLGHLRTQVALGQHKIFKK